MNHTEETLNATLDAYGQLSLSHPPRLPPGPVRVTIRSTVTAPRGGVTDVIRRIAAEQRAEGFPGRSAEELQSEQEAQLDEDMARDKKLDAARGASGFRRP